VTEAGSPDAPTPHADRRRAVIGIAFGLLAFAGAGFAVYGQRHEFADSIARVGVLLLGVAFLLGVVGVGLTLGMWRQVLSGLDVDIPWRPAFRVYFTSQLGKYVPGSVWPIVMQMEAGRARGAARRSVLAANLITIVLSCAVARYWWLLAATPFLLLFLHPRAVPTLLDRLLLLVKREALGGRLDVAHTLRASAWAVGSFVALGLHIAVLTLAVGGRGMSTVLLAIGGMSMAIPAGILFIPAPAGAGIRDVVLILVLRPVLNPGQALAVVVASRVLLLLGDIALAAAAGAVGRRR
jgi:hypothetical protein